MQSIIEGFFKWLWAKASVTMRFAYCIGTLRCITPSKGIKLIWNEVLCDKISYHFTSLLQNRVCCMHLYICSNVSGYLSCKIQLVKNWSYGDWCGCVSWNPLQSSIDLQKFFENWITGDQLHCESEQCISSSATHFHSSLIEESKWRNRSSSLLHIICSASLISSTL